MSHYGNYKPNFILENRNSFLGRLKHFWLEVKGFVIRGKKNAIRAISVALGAILLFSSLNSCKPEQIIVEKDKLVYVTKDSIVQRDSTVYVPVELYKDYSRLTDTLVLETSLATAKAWNDTTAWTIQGYINNKSAIEYKYIEVDKWHTKDSLIYKEVPVPYEVEVVKTHIPTWSWLCLAWFLITMASIAWGIYKRFFKK